MIDAFGPDVAVQVQLALLTATMKLFFKRPPEMRAMLRASAEARERLEALTRLRFDEVPLSPK